MKIEKIASKSDLIHNLKKAAQLSNIHQLELLGEYIRQEKDLKNLKDGLIIQEYEVKLAPGAYQIVVIESQFDSTKNIWEILSSTVVEEITFEELKVLELEKAAQEKVKA